MQWKLVLVEISTYQEGCLVATRAIGISHRRCQPFAVPVLFESEDGHLIRHHVSAAAAPRLAKRYRLTNKAVTVLLAVPKPSGDLMLNEPEGEGKGYPGEGKGESPERGSAVCGY